MALEVDERLIARAQLLTTGAEIHTTRELISMYRGAARGKGTPQERNAFTHFERALQDHCLTLQRKKDMYASLCGMMHT